MSWLLLQTSTEGLASFYTAVGTAMLVLVIASIAAVVYSLYVIWTSEMEQNWKLKWSAVVIILSLIGAIVFHFVGKKEMKQEEE